VGSGIKIIGVADNFYGAREGAALPLEAIDFEFNHLTLYLTLKVLNNKNKNKNRNKKTKNKELEIRRSHGLTEPPFRPAPGPTTSFPGPAAFI
jgi:hypothetical protein